MAAQIAIVSSIRPIPERIYLDHAATTPLRPEAKAAMEEGFRLWANPSSPHAEGRKARAMLEDARERIKVALGWDGELIFTSCASEALAIGLGRAKAERRIVSAVEHDAVFRAVPSATVVPMAGNFLDLEALYRALKEATRPVVALQTINSETGQVVINLPGPDNEIVDAIRARGGLLLADCSQSAGKFPLPFADLLVVSAHKLGGPIGIGALLVRDFALLEPSGGHERGYRAGTENLPGAMGFAAALEAGGIASWATTEADRTDFHTLMLQNKRIASSGAMIDYIMALTHPELSAQAQLIRLDALGFSVSTGSACSSGSLKPSRVLKAFGFDDETASRTIRVSLGWTTTSQQLDRFADAWLGLAA